MNCIIFECAANIYWGVYHFVVVSSSSRCVWSYVFLPFRRHIMAPTALPTDSPWIVWPQTLSVWWSWHGINEHWTHRRKTWCNSQQQHTPAPAQVNSLWILIISSMHNSKLMAGHLASEIDSTAGGRLSLMNIRWNSSIIFISPTRHLFLSVVVCACVCAAKFMLWWHFLPLVAKWKQRRYDEML